MKNYNFYLEYVWLDGNYPQQIRSKTKIIEKTFAEYDTDFRETLIKEWKEDISKLPVWNFDGSSTGQSQTSKSELLLKPVNVYIDPFKWNGFIVLSEVLNTDGTPHSTNKRNKLANVVDKYDSQTMYGLEQEYFIYNVQTQKPLGWPSDPRSFPRPQGDYYCGVGGKNVVGREFVDHHTELCLSMGLKVSGINAEVALGQWEYQIGPVYALEGADQLWVSRYILERLTEQYGYYIVLDPKPYKGTEWNGSGMHLNFSTLEMRTDMKNKKKLVIEACERIGEKIEEHIDVYGPGNEDRLTGHNETCSISEFRFAIGDRTASIRIPSSINDETTPGYLEDRRPSSNADPYEIIARMIKTVCKTKKKEKAEQV